jgi:DNA-binding transcriptional MocR family regulator
MGQSASIGPRLRIDYCPGVAGETSVGAADVSRLLGSWADPDRPLPESLAAALIGLIEAGLLAPGTRLPPQRLLAEALGTARGTVAVTYEALEARGYLSARQGSGSWVRSRTGEVPAHISGRLFSFTDAADGVVDLSSGALPASAPVRAALAHLQPYLDTDGYFPAGLPALRTGIATTMASPATSADRVLVTAGGQQATWLAAANAAGPGDLVLMEEPSYRGAIECFADLGAKVHGLRMVHGGIDVDHVRREIRRGARVLYCQTGIHNPTGSTMAAPARRALADEINRAGLLTIEDTSSGALSLGGPATAPTLAGLVDPALLVTVGTMSKLFWGGLRLGWIMAEPSRVHRLTEQRKAIGLATSVVDQALGLSLLGEVAAAGAERRAFLRGALAETETVVAEVFPDWTWERPAGGSGLWVDTHADGVRLAEAGKRIGVKLAPGPSFSTYGGLRSYLRLPIWHDADVLARSLTALRDAHI